MKLCLVDLCTVLPGVIRVVQRCCPEIRTEISIATVILISAPYAISCAKPLAVICVRYHTAEGFLPQ